MGSKANAKAIMSAAGVPVTPGYWGEDGSLERFIHEAEGIGYPVMLKAVRGGGGKGMRIVRSREELPSALEACKREASNSFGSSAVLVERYLPRPRHIEFQVVGDRAGNVVHLFERDCSVQRRHQKVLEEAPAPRLPLNIRSAMGEAAVKAARAVGYVGAGTVEFMLDWEAIEGGGRQGRAKNNETPFFFMEMNCRLQVEHPVTEMILGGLDLVELQLRVAAGRPLGLTQEDIAARLRGHALEARVCAENPSRDFLPATGTLKHLALPRGSMLGGTLEAHTPWVDNAPRVRVDSALVSGDSVSMYYDSMVSKLIVWGETREEALATMSRSLASYQMVGLPSNISFLQRLVSHPEFVAGAVDTSFLVENLKDCLPPPSETSSTPPHILLSAGLAATLRELGLFPSPTAQLGGAAVSWKNPWAPGTVTSLEPMQPTSRGLELTIGQMGEGGANTRLRFTPLGNLAISVNGMASAAPGFRADFLAEGSEKCASEKSFIVAGVFVCGDGNDELSMHCTPSDAEGGLLSVGTTVHKYKAVFTPLPVKALGGVVGGGGSEISIFPRDPAFTNISGTRSVVPASSRYPSQSSEPPFSGAYRLLLPELPVGKNTGVVGGGVSAGVKSVVAPMPGKVIKLLVKEGSTHCALVPSPPTHSLHHNYSDTTTQSQLWAQQGTLSLKANLCLY